MAAAYPTTYRSTLLAAKTGTNPRPCGGQRPSSPGKPCSSLSTILKRREQLHEIFIPSEGIDKHFFREHFKSYFGDTVEWREGTHSNTGVEGYVLKSAKEIVISDGMIRALRIHSRDHRRQRLEVARSGYFDVLHRSWFSHQDYLNAEEAAAKKAKRESAIPYLNLPPAPPNYHAVEGLHRDPSPSQSWPRDQEALNRNQAGKGRSDGATAEQAIDRWTQEALTSESERKLSRNLSALGVFGASPQNSYRGVAGSSASTSTSTRSRPVSCPADMTSPVEGYFPYIPSTPPGSSRATHSYVPVADDYVSRERIESEEQRLGSRTSVSHAQRLLSTQSYNRQHQNPSHPRTSELFLPTPDSTDNGMDGIGDTHIENSHFVYVPYSEAPMTNTRSYHASHAADPRLTHGPSTPPPRIVWSAEVGGYVPEESVEGNGDALDEVGEGNQNTIQGSAPYPTRGARYRFADGRPVWC